MEATGIADTCICLDLWHGRLLPHLAQLGLKWIIPDVVAAELQRPPPREFVAAGMAISSATPEEVATVQTLRTRHRKPSTADLIALSMARARGAILLTGDRHLRDAAGAEGVQTRGVLWLLDSLEETTPGTMLAASLDGMIASGARLPQAEVARRLARWRGGV